MPYIPLSKCKHGFLYMVHARNFSYGVFNSRNNSFIGVRYKLGSSFLFPELHHDADPHFGTVKPLSELVQLPPAIQISDSIYDDTLTTDLWAERNGMRYPVIRRNIAREDKPHGRRVLFEDLWLDTKERIPDELWPYSIPNKSLFTFLSDYTANHPPPDID